MHAFLIKAIWSAKWMAPVFIQGLKPHIKHQQVLTLWGGPHSDLFLPCKVLCLFAICILATALEQLSRFWYNACMACGLLTECLRIMFAIAHQLRCVQCQLGNSFASLEQWMELVSRMCASLEIPAPKGHECFPISGGPSVLFQIGQILLKFYTRKSTVSHSLL